MFIHHNQEKRKFKGQGLVEFALTLPIFLVLLFGVFETARLIFLYSAVFTASRDAARFAGAPVTALRA